jgi:hypothetical protein
MFMMRRVAHAFIVPRRSRTSPGDVFAGACLPHSQKTRRIARIRAVQIHADAFAQPTHVAGLGLPALFLNEHGKVLACNSLAEALSNYVQSRAFDRISLKDKAADQLLRDAIATIDIAGGPVRPAYMWFSLAAVQGDEKARKALDHVESMITPEQRSEAQKLAREWKPTDVARRDSASVKRERRIKIN